MRVSFINFYKIGGICKIKKIARLKKLSFKIIERLSV